MKGTPLTRAIASDLILAVFDGQTDVPYRIIKEQITQLHMSKGGLSSTNVTVSPVTRGLAHLKIHKKANNPRRGFWTIDSAGV